ncbi:MAG: NAD(P)-dependent oxidoreductase [Kiritimatiellae bacterium]|nr:NAD(P)-dependent oxidoreductase [Kiritimatiellia bacterium]
MRREGRPQRRTIPLNLIVDDRKVLVVGGGQVGRRKTQNLLEAGAAVELVCPDCVEALRGLAESGRIVWTRRAFRPGDVAGHLLVFACTDDKHVNRAILDEARAAHVPCCCSDMNWCDGDFTTPATARLGDLVVAVSTSGQSCKAARDVKNEIVAALGEGRDLELLVLGTCDALLPSRKRAPYHLPSEERAVLGPLLKRVRGVREFFILNTCNRVELVAVASRDPGVAAVLRRLTGFDRLAPEERFELTGFDAFRHLARVASGLESSLLGEFHIVSQVKDALAEAERNGWSAGAIQFAGAEVLRVSKAVRHAVEGMLRVAEIDQVAVRYLGVHGGLDAKTHVVVVGTGMVGRGAVEALVAMGVRLTWIYHVNVPEAPAGVAVRRMDELPEVLKDADVVLSAVDSSRPVVTREMAPSVMDRNVLFVDLGVPRNIDPYFDDCGHGVTVADLDDLKLWHRVKTGTLNEVLAKADEVVRAEYRDLV